MDPRIFLDGRVTLYAGDCLDVLDRLPANSVDCVITDPPYHFDTIVQRFGKDGAAPAKFGSDGIFARSSAGFMGKDWDGGDIAFRPETWGKVLRVLKPGGHLAAFSAPKCVHKMAFGIEAAGFEVRDRIINLIDPNERLVAFLESLTAAQADALFRLTDQFGALGEAFWTFGSGFPKSHDVSKAIDKMLGAKREVVGTETVKDISNGNGRGCGDGINASARTAPEYIERDITVPASVEAEQWDGWGTALKPAYEPIIIARKPLAESSVARQVLKTGTGGINIDAARVQTDDEIRATRNVALGSAASGVYRAANEPGEYLQKDGGRFPANLTHDGSGIVVSGFPGGDAARFFYTAKADQHDRIGSGHPTVKPLDLMQWLCRMLCPPGGTVLDLFGGSGTTGEAAYREGFNAILIEREPEYQADIARRMENATAGPVERRHVSIKAKNARRKAMQPAEPLIGDIFGGGGAAPMTAASCPAPAASVSGNANDLFGDSNPDALGGRQIYGRFADEGDRRRQGR